MSAIVAPFGRQLDAHGAAQLLGLDVSSVKRLSYTKKLPCFKVGGLIRYYENDLIAWMEVKRAEALAHIDSKTRRAVRAEIRPSVTQPKSHDDILREHGIRKRRLSANG